MYNKGIKNIYGVKEEEFKVGDWVVRIKEAGGKHSIGRILKIHQIISTEEFRAEDESVHNLSSVRKATPEEIAFVTKSKLRFDYKFKIGDKVKIVKNGIGYAPECIGEVVEILELGEYLGKPGYRTSKTKGTSNTNNGFCNSMAEERSFELYTEEVMFEKDKWYKYSKDYSMFGCYQKDGMGYGFTVSKKWTDTLSMSDTNWLPATDEEVKEILLKYAKEQQKYIDYNYTMSESEFKEWDNPKDIPFIPENLVSESKKISPCKEGDYLYLIDATIGGTELSYKEHTGSVLQVTNIKPDGKNTWWVKYTPTSFGGGGCRINGNGWQWNKHIRLATSYEIEKFKAGWKLPRVEDLTELTWKAAQYGIESKITKEEKVKVQLINVPKI